MKGGGVSQALNQVSESFGKEQELFEGDQKLTGIVNGLAEKEFVLELFCCKILFVIAIDSGLEIKLYFALEIWLNKSVLLESSLDIFLLDIRLLLTVDKHNNQFSSSIDAPSFIF